MQFSFISRLKSIFQEISSFFIFYLFWLCISFQILGNNQLDTFFMYLFISWLYVFRASHRSSSGDRIVLIHHLVWLVFVSDCLVCQSGGNCISPLADIPISHLHRLIIPDDVLTHFYLLMISSVTLETFRDMK